MLFFAGVAIRYAPFIWIAGLLGFAPALLLARRAARLDVGDGPPTGKGVPEVPAFLGYAYLVAIAGAAMSMVGDDGAWLAAAILACIGPLHAVILLGWREHLRRDIFPGGGLVAAAISAAAVVGLLSLTLYDRYARDPSPVASTAGRGSLLILGGVDSTSDTGALSEFDSRQVGFPPRAQRHLSYERGGGRYEAADTRRDLDASAEIVASQLERARIPRHLLGHSQAALILDRMIVDGSSALPERAVMLAPPPPVPPPVEVPPPGTSGPGRPGGDAARALAWLMERVGMNAYDVDAGASPAKLDAVVARDGPPRLSVWALGDSVWLDRDWRRPGETSVVALTDHVGVTNNGWALDQTRLFFAGEEVESDEVSWRAALVGLLRYAFEPWRPG